MISRRLHAVLDAASVAALLAVPAAAGWPKRPRSVATAAAVAVAGYASVTRYGDEGRMPLAMREHLVLDALQGAAVCLAARGERDVAARRLLQAYGAFSIAAALLTDRGPPRGARHGRA